MWEWMNVRGLWLKGEPMERQIFPDTGRVSRAKTELAKDDLAAACDADRLADGGAPENVRAAALPGWLARRLVTLWAGMVALGERLAVFGEPVAVSGGDPQRC